MAKKAKKSKKKNRRNSRGSKGGKRRQFSKVQLMLRRVNQKRWAKVQELCPRSEDSIHWMLNADTGRWTHCINSLTVALFNANLDESSMVDCNEEPATSAISDRGVQNWEQVFKWYPHWGHQLPA